ncbi:MAG: chemotaxis protein CheY [Alphaproteobacteria bacterium]|nr:chemotaxis protein CheY [Alphaproteobacteria bacterium]MDB5740693.1 chemotaxis protein CheY [Alphaproteobacteria bacterium]
MPLPPKHIAILDDDKSVRTALSRLLNASGMNAVCFATCTSFLNSLEQNMWDCVVLDLQMPQMTGMEVLEYITQARISVPIVIVTAHDELGSPEACLAAGVSAYLRKPIRADSLIDAISTAIQSSEAVS